MPAIIKSITKKSTQAFFRAANQIPNFSLFDKIHGYVYLRWPYLYIGIAKGDHPLAKIIGPIWRISQRFIPNTNGDDPDKVEFADTYHGKVVPMDSAVQLVSVKEDIRINDLEQIIPYKKARSIVLENPDHIVVLDCPCRSSRENPCLPLDVCLIIGEPFASYVAEHHEARSRRITQDDAIEILTEVRERGHVSHAFFKDAMLERFYAICNCCQCCCGAMQAHFNGTPMLASSGYVSQVNPDMCIGCGECQTYCQFNAITTWEGHSFIRADLCMGCGVCEVHCEQEAISLQRDETRGIPLEIDKLVADFL